VPICAVQSRPFGELASSPEGRIKKLAAAVEVLRKSLRVVFFIGFVDSI